MTSYRVRFNAERTEVTQTGISSAIPGNRAKVLGLTSTHVTLAFRGFSANPGSRYSGITEYYPAETVVMERATPGSEVETLRVVTRFPSGKAEQQKAISEYVRRERMRAGQEQGS